MTKIRTDRDFSSIRSLDTVSAGLIVNERGGKRRNLCITNPKRMFINGTQIQLCQLWYCSNQSAKSSCSSIHRNRMMLQKNRLPLNMVGVLVCDQNCRHRFRCNIIISKPICNPLIADAAIYQNSGGAAANICTVSFAAAEQRTNSCHRYPPCKNKAVQDLVPTARNFYCARTDSTNSSDTLRISAPSAANFSSMTSYPRSKG